MYGRHAVLAALANPRRKVDAVWCTEEGLAAAQAALAGRPEDSAAAAAAPIPATKGEIDARLPEGSVHQGILARVAPLPDTTLEDLLDATAGLDRTLVMILDQVTDPQNVGAILRSTAAFGGRALILPDRNAPPVTASLAKTASGAVDAVPIVRVTNLARALESLKQAGFWCTGLAEEGAVTLDQAALDGKAALVMGAEGSGLRRLTRETCDQLARLPTVPPIGSLNVSAAAAVALYQATLSQSR